MKPDRPRVCVVMPAYNAARTIEKTYRDIPLDSVDDIIVVDDVSRDDTVDTAVRLGLPVIVHRQNRGYGGNQKTCYLEALIRGADVVVMLHPDYQYDSTKIPAMIEPILRGEADVVFGSRFLSPGGALAGGMPLWRFVANRFLTTTENVAFGLRLSECHTGFRAYSRKFLTTIPFLLNSDDFVFDTEVIAQAAHFGFQINEVAVPTRYFAEASSVPFRRAVVYGLSTLAVVGRYLLHHSRLRRDPIFSSELSQVLSSAHQKALHNEPVSEASLSAELQRIQELVQLR
jgi:glycosyltransferase involved in cell wall biosynthesis